MRSTHALAVALLALTSACAEADLAVEDVSTAATLSLAPGLSPGEPDLRVALLRERVAPHRMAFAGDPDALPAEARVTHVELTGRGDLQDLKRIRAAELVAVDPEGEEELLALLDDEGMLPRELDLLERWEDPELDLYVRVRGESLTAGDELRVEVVFSVLARR